jgi:S1-C subfamily serine protease
LPRISEDGTGARAQRQRRLTGGEGGRQGRRRITSFNGETVTSSSEFSCMAARAKDGEVVTLGILRDRKPITVKLTPEGAPRRPALLHARPV